MVNNEKIPLLNRIPLTRIKLIIARILYFFIKMIIRDDRQVISRNHIQYEIDLSEGIDLSLFLFSGFQSHITRSSLYKLPNDAVIFDVGANIGSMTLRFAQNVPQGYVYAFEPTDYAFEKLTKNIALNPSLSKRITSIQTFVSDKSTDHAALKAYSSWKINGTGNEKHPVHGGILKSDTENKTVPAITIDEFYLENCVNKLSLIKIDTDGHELKVLKGSVQVMRKFRPVIIFEAGLSCIREQNVCFKDYIELLTQHNYILYTPKKKIVNIENYIKRIPYNYTIDIIALPQNLPG